ncbi:MAG: ISNCY family transposase [Gemmatimonadota bacterium]|jgi:IS5 family transposase|nr:ISNCY family transposase [Gemmatimonadota bacterium]MDQ3606210.1 ISNCY family transposase [Gemmatimonadota bacterium]
MRRHEQLSLDQPWIAHPHAWELATISGILDSNPGMAEAVAQDLLAGVANPHTGSRGMSGDQVLRVLIVKQMNGFSYEQLHFHLLDSASYRTFCRFGALEKVPARSTLAENLKKVRPQTLERINRLLLSYAAVQGVEKGRKVRIDSTVVETNIHPPTDSSLLWDGVRVLTRLLGEAREVCGFSEWSDHRRRAKRRALAVQNAKAHEARLSAYRDLLQATRRTVGYAQGALAALSAQAGAAGTAPEGLREELEEMLLWVGMVIDQTERRVLWGEVVPAEEKVVSLFEPHTDIISKEKRETQFGHKINLTGGASGLILDCVIESGNPADSTRAVPMLERQCEIYGRPPRQASFDGGFVSKPNLRAAKQLGVEDVCFTKRRGLAVLEMVRSSWVYKRLRDFRAGVEGLISYLKRAFGLDRCTWNGDLSFQSYVWASVLSANLLTLARHLLS